MLYLGNQTACWAAKLTDPFDYALARHFDAFEWFPDKKPGAGWDERDLDARARETIRATARARGLRLSVHARWQANPLAPDGNWLLAKDVELARDLGAVLLNIHLYHEQGVAAFVEAIRPLLRQTAAAGLLLSLENTPEHAPELFNDLFTHLRNLGEADTRHVGVCFDMGHANLCAATLNDYLAFIDRLDPRVPIIHLHLHENWGDADSHLPLFTGPASRDDAGLRGLLARLQRRHFSGAAILEQWPNPPSLLDQARERLLKLWQPGAAPTRPARAPSQPATRALTIPPQPCRTSSGGGFIARVAAGDRPARSWREKLDFARSLLGRETPPLTADELVVIAVYLRFLGTGEIACEEDGRHFRPAHHARIAAEIRQKLARLSTPENAFVLRKIYPWLPSSAADFRRPEPLTRIRDIAHRNDIDPELKREIKATLQNKLHRCAGPEDLETSSALLARITAPGTRYPPAFVDQFRVFHEELKEFFNAQSLQERLQALEPAADPGLLERIRSFLRQKAGQELAQRLEAFRGLTALRQALQAPAPDHEPAQNPDRLLADIALEDFAFTLASELINQAEIAGGEQADNTQTEALVLALQNLELSAINPAESRALTSELQAWGRVAPGAARDEILRLKACLLRCRRLAEDFGARLVELFSSPAEALGRALGVTPEAIRVFCEGDLRGHLVFQISKLVSALLRQIRQRLRAPPWDVLVSGEATGKLVVLDSVDDLPRDSQEPLVALLKSAAGDEEIPARIAGLVLCQELPHLSHLSVRARQAGVVLVACEDNADFGALRQFEGRRICLSAWPDAVAWEAAESVVQTQHRRPRVPLRVPPARLSAEPPWIPLEQATLETAGGKAEGVRRLAELSRREASGFRTPPGLVIPFGVMESALSVATDLHLVYRQLLESLKGNSTEAACLAEKFTALMQRVPVPEAIVIEIARRFGPESALIVRSSANCEDLEQFAGAGLYESVINVAPKDVVGAIRAVWASLWTARAVASRAEAGIPHEHAHMAMLIQQLLEPDFSFVLHTVDPVCGNQREVYAEIVVGLGETLVSAARPGTAYRLTCDKQSGVVVTLAFANFSQAAHPKTGGGINRETIDYSTVELSRDATAREKLGRRLAQIGAFIEQALGKPQDIEGAVVNGEIFLVQARPQQGLPPTA